MRWRGKIAVQIIKANIQECLLSNSDFLRVP